MLTDTVAVDAAAWFVGMWGVGYLIVEAAQALIRGRNQVNSLLDEWSSCRAECRALTTATGALPGGRSAGRRPVSELESDCLN